MGIWTDEEIGTLVNLWQTHSAEQIARRMHRPRSAICAMACRLRSKGVLPRDRAKHRADDLRKHPLPRRGQPPRTQALPPKPPAEVSGVIEMRPCPLLELDDSRCHWPLGEPLERAVLFCGAAVQPTGRCYCAHHMRLVRG